jgi:hypothetical protein
MCDLRDPTFKSDDPRMADEVGASFLWTGWNHVDSYGDYYCLCDQSKAQSEMDSNSPRPSDLTFPTPKRSLVGSREQDDAEEFIDRRPKGLETLLLLM